MNAEIGNKIRKFWKNGMLSLAVIAISLAYVFYNEVTIERTELVLWQVLAKAIIGILCGVLIKQGIGENGFTIGYNSKLWEGEMGKYNESCNMANKYMDRVENFYYSQEIEKRTEYRRAMLMNARLRYSDFFDDQENFIGEDKIKKLTREQRRIVNKCIRVKIYNLNLFSEYSRETASATKKETGDSTQRFKMFGKNSLSQTLVAIAGAYFVPVMDGWNWAKFIWATLQVAMWATTGIMQAYYNYNYIIVDKVNKLKTKKELIQKFVYGCDKGMYQFNPYKEREKGVIEDGRESRDSTDRREEEES